MRSLTPTFLPQSLACQRGERNRARRDTLNPRIPFVVCIILPIAALAAMEACQAGDGLDALDVLGLFVAELPLDPEAQRRSVGHREQMPVHSPSDDRLRVKSVDEVDALVIGLLAEAVGTVKDNIFRASAEARLIEDARKTKPVPFADRSPSLDAVVARDLNLMGDRA